MRSKHHSIKKGTAELEIAIRRIAGLATPTTLPERAVEEDRASRTTKKTDTRVV